jgi:hypothetical protein
MGSMDGNDPFDKLVELHAEAEQALGGIPAPEPANQRPASLSLPAFMGLLKPFDGPPCEPPPPSPEELAQEARGAIRYWAEQLRDAGHTKEADKILAAIGPRRPAWRPTTVGEADETRAAAADVLRSMSETNNPRGRFARACRKHCPPDVRLATFMRRIERVCLRVIGLRPLDLGGDEEQN